MHPSEPAPGSPRYALPPDPWLVRSTLALAVAFGVVYVTAVLPSLTADGLAPGTRVFLWGKLAAEVLFAFPAATMLLVAGAYLIRPGQPVRYPPLPGAPPPIGIVYLCCGDLDSDAVRSLARLRYQGDLHLVIHDDARTPDRRIEALVGTLPARAGLHVHILRRPVHDGGKPGAVNHVLHEIGHRFEFFLLCDNDSHALDPDCLPRLLAPMADPAVAAVQARNVALDDPRYGSVNRVLCRAIDVFHLFLDVARRFGWTPFVGHNALLRMRAVVDAGGLTPGFFADDIDLTVRLNLRGQRVVYAGDVPFGETHPPSYAAFRRRTYKWARGSVQVLRRHAFAVLRSPEMTLAEKWGFFSFIGFYTQQTLLLAYVALLYLVGPFVLPRADFDVGATLIAGSVIPLLIFLPVIVFALRHGRLRSLPAFLATCWLGYGATDFPTARGTLGGLRTRDRPWVPTNSIRADGITSPLLLEAGFGLALLLVPMLFFPPLLMAPLTFVIALKFLFIPTMAVAYSDEPVALRVPRLATALLALVPFLLFASPKSGAVMLPSDQSVRVRGNELVLGGEPWTLKGVHYGPWRPGTGPGRADYPSPAEVEADVRLIGELGANALLVYDPPRYVLDLAWRRGLRVLCAAWIEWPGFGTETFAARRDAILAQVDVLRDHPGLLGWVLGNEIPTWVITDRGADRIESALEGLYRDVKARDPQHFITHANWPNARSLDLSFLDVCAFNVYALWPPEVVARGYGNFVRDVLRPLAGDRPLLISEFGANALEAGEDGQARLDRECWEGLRGAGAVGGFVFEFADEWWKNYSNPKLEGAWWDRVDDNDDHLRHDRDPEEHYGLVTAERVRKPAFAAVAAMYGVAAEGLAPTAATFPWPRPGTLVVVGALLAAALSLVIVISNNNRRLRATAPVDSLP